MANFYKTLPTKIFYNRQNQLCNSAERTSKLHAFFPIIVYGLTLLYFNLLNNIILDTQ